MLNENPQAKFLTKFSRLLSAIERAEALDTRLLVD